MSPRVGSCLWDVDPSAIADEAWNSEQYEYSAGLLLPREASRAQRVARSYSLVELDYTGVVEWTIMALSL